MKMCCVHTMESYSAVKISEIHKYMDGSRKYYIDWNNPDIQSQTLFYLSFYIYPDMTWEGLTGQCK